ncbi:MAG: Potassium channel [Candelina submexicana]|nr:MAG: Potassium channel [Candelina submexicana]
MNDPGLDEPISNGAESVEKKREDQDAGEEEEEKDYLDPSRWWLLSTAAPLIAGTFGPMASAFNICALAQNWRVEIPPDGGTEEHGFDIKDPKWVLAVNGISLAVALISNLALLLNMARRVSFTIAQPITIIGWYITSILLIALIGANSTVLQLPSPPNHAMTQAFYYAIIAAVLYFLCASLMVGTVYGVYKGHYDREFKLTISQRTLMLQTISYLIYLLAGGAVFAHIEKWKFLDGLYWADFTLLTIGIGDYAPTTHLGRGLLFPYAIGGIVILGLVVGSIRSLVLERGKNKMGARMVEKIREDIVRDLKKGKKSSKLIPIEHVYEGANDKSEKERREQEFNLMRKVQARATRKQRWMSLSLSLTAWFLLWFIGAVVFWKSEGRNQGWTYFQAVYFAYVSLLTIGYGDFSPLSNAGKPFFVFWSLLAVPALTILISNMGDTVVKGIRDLTLWIGDFTVLPRESGAVATLKRGAAAATKGKVGWDESIMEEPPGLIGKERKKDPRSQKGADIEATGRLAEEAEDEELSEAEDAKRHGDKLGEDIHFYHYLLVKELRNVMSHTKESPPRKYSYDEWAWYLKLIGEDEANPSWHKTAQTRVGRDDKNKYPNPPEAERGDVNFKDEPWSWIGNQSPLMGNKEESEWILERISITLEKEMQKKRRNQKRDKGDVPVSRHSSNTLGEHKRENSDGTKDRNEGT